jgi:hypothetical protein
MILQSHSPSHGRHAPNGGQPVGDDDAGDDKGKGNVRSNEAKGKRKQPPTNVIPASTPHIESGRVIPTMDTLSATTGPRQTITLTNPFANRAELEALRRSFAEQPNLKAATESWEGTAEENIKKWQCREGDNVT